MKRSKKFLKYLLHNQIFFKQNFNMYLNKIIRLSGYLKSYVIYSVVPKYHIIWSLC